MRSNLIDTDKVYAVRIASTVVPAKLSDKREHPRHASSWPDYAITLPDDLPLADYARVARRLDQRNWRVTPGMVQMTWDAWQELRADEAREDAEREARRMRYQRAFAGLRADQHGDDTLPSDLGDTIAQEFDACGPYYYAEQAGPTITWEELDAIAQRIIETTALAEQSAADSPAAHYNESYIAAVEAAIEAAEASA